MARVKRTGILILDVLGSIEDRLAEHEAELAGCAPDRADDVRNRIGLLKMVRALLRSEVLDITFQMEDIDQGQFIFRRYGQRMSMAKCSEMTGFTSAWLYRIQRDALDSFRSAADQTGCRILEENADILEYLGISMPDAVSGDNKNGS